ncbi:hypothetical protein SAMN02910456_01943 [Ruminococcaceae bacterium YRB3002]|nr:hypothetical protein SAMN02910456_01943 [Ruminococcaceae bacterium YRB3002]
MNKKALLSAALCMALLASAAGCSETKETSESVSDTTQASAVTSGAESSAADTEATADPAGHSDHQISVEDLSSTTLSDNYGNYTTVIPKLVVDGQEAVEINTAMSSYLLKNYPMHMSESGDIVEGYDLSYDWGSRDNIVSIIVIAGFIGEDGARYEIFNYDVDTLTQLEDSEMVSRMGMTDQEFFKKTSDVYEKYWDTEPWLGIDNKDLLERSIAAINYDNVTPFITPNGNYGVAGLIYTPSQIFESVHCFNFATMESEYFM